MELSLGALLVRVIVSLGVVLAIMAGAAAVLRRSGVVGGRTSSRRRTARVEVVSRQALGRSSSLTVVRLGERGFVLGVTESSISLLGEIDPAELLADTPKAGLPGATPSPGLVGPAGPEAPGTASPGRGFPPALLAWKAVLENLRDRTVRRS
jgi:flagellar protein FliO/FliZ